MPRSPRRDRRSSALITVPYLLGILALPACAPTSARPPPAAPPPPSSAVAAPSPSIPDTKRRLLLRIDPVPGDTPHVHIELEAGGEPADLARWSLLEGELSEITNLTISDASGERRPTIVAGHGSLHFQLDLPPRSPATLSYDVAPKDRRAPGSVHLDPDTFHAGGEHLLFLPDALEQLPVHMSVTLVPTHLHALFSASSFGVGETREREARGRDLRYATFLAGPVGHAILDAYEGHDEAAWLGFTSFDSRWVAAETAGVRSTAAQYFADRSQLPSTLLIVSEKRRSGSPFSVHLRTGGVLVHAQLDAAWNVAARLPVAHELVHRWIGGKLWIGSREPSEQALGYWFSEGFARAVAREVLSAFGTLGPADYGDEINRLEAVVATSSLRQRSLAELARLAIPGDPRALSLIIARGALYATRLDATVRTQSKGKRSLRDVLQRLLATAEEGKTSSLPLSDFLNVLGEEAGDGEPAEFQAFLDGRKRELPDNSLGPCFAQGRRTYRELALGIDRSATESEARVIGLEKGGPAEAAGLHEGDAVEKLTVVETPAGGTVTLVVKREGKETTISYPAKATSLPGWGWTRRKEVRDDKCDRR